MSPRILLLIAAFTLSAPPAHATRTKAEQQRRVRLKQALQQVWTKHVAPLVRAGNTTYTDDPIELSYDVGRMTESARKVTFDATLRYESHRGIEPATQKLSVDRAAIEQFLANGGDSPPALQSSKKAFRFARTRTKARLWHTYQRAMEKLSSIEDIAAFVNTAVARDPLALERIKYLLQEWGPPASAGAWYVAVRARHATPAAWPAPRDPLKLIPQLIAGAGIAGQNLYAHAVYELEHPQEILAFVSYVAAWDAKAGLVNAKFAGTEYIETVAKDAWKKAVESVEATKGQPLSPWLVSLLGRGERALSPMQAVRDPAGYVARLKREAGKAGMKNWFRYAIGKAKHAAEIAVVVDAVRRDHGPSGLDELKFLSTVYDTRPEEHPLWAAALAEVAR